MLSEKLFEDALVKYPELIEKNLKLIGRQVTHFGKRIDILFEDRFKEKLIVEIKIDNLQRNALSQVMEYEGYILSEKDPSARVMIVANRIPLNLKKAMDHHGIEYKEITHKHLLEFLEKRDEQLLNAITHQKQEEPLGHKSNIMKTPKRDTLARHNFNDEMKQAKTLTGIEFKYEGSLDTELTIYQNSSINKISKENIAAIKSEIEQRSPVLMGANRTNPSKYSIGESLMMQRYSPQSLSYVIPMLIKDGFCAANNKKPFVITKI